MAAKQVTKQTPPIRIGVIADTHGYLDPQVLAIFAGVDLVIHAGDIVDSATLTALKEVAPLTAVAGNVDPADLAASLLREATGEGGGVSVVVSHKRKRLLKRLAAGKIAFGAAGATPDLVVFGHEHVPSAVWVESTLFLNPGTASSPEEEDDGPTVAIVEAEPTGLAVRFVPLRRRSEAEVAASLKAAPES